MDGRIVLTGVTVVGRLPLPSKIDKKRRFEIIKKASVHFRERLLERYGISLTLRQYLMINKNLKRPKESVFILKINDTDVRVTYKNGMLVTALPIKCYPIKSK